MPHTDSTELWKPVIGFEALYEVSDHGRVRSLGRTVRTTNAQNRTYKPRLMSIQSQSSGHQSIGLRRDTSGYTFRVHRLVLEAFVGPCPDGLECRHLDGDPTNNYLANLAWATHAENMADTVLHGTSIRGLRNPNARLTEDQVREIRARRGEPLKVLAAEFGMSKPAICNIHTGKRWGWLE